jgi:O-antigen/teichoic acid export membrane protein
VHSFTVQLADFGLGAVAVTELASGRALRDGAPEYGQVRHLALRRLGSAIGIGTAMTLIALVIPALEPYRLAVLVGAGGAVFWSMDLFFISSLQGLRRFHAAAALAAIIGVLRLVLVSAWAIVGLQGIDLLLAYAVVAPGIALPIAGLIVLAQRRKLRALAEGSDSVDPAPPSARPAVTTEFRRSVMTMYLGGAALFNFDVLLLALISTQGDVATYSAAWRVAAGASLVNTAITQAVLPYTIAAADPWREARLLSRIGGVVTAMWVVLVPVLTLAGVAVLGSAGDDAAAPMAILLLAFALDGYCALTVQIYFRINRARIAAIALVSEFATMVVVTLAFRGTGALAPSLGQLSARLLAVVIIAGPIVLASRGRLGWFEVAEVDAVGGEGVGLDVRAAEERLGL